MLNEPIQITTAVIDLITSILGFIFSILLNKVKGDKKLKNKWIHFMLVMSVANLCGFIYHIFIYDEFAYKLMWIPLFLIMYDISVMFNLIMIYDLRKDKNPNKIERIILIILTLICYVASNIYSFIIEIDMRIYVIFTAILVIIGVVIAVYLFFKNKRKPLGILALILIPQLIGGYFQITKTGYFKLLFEFNYDGIYHLCLLVSVVIMYIGAKKDIEFEE